MFLVKAPKFCFVEAVENWQMVTIIDLENFCVNFKGPSSILMHYLPLSVNYCWEFSHISLHINNSGNNNETINGNDEVCLWSPPQITVSCHDKGGSNYDKGGFKGGSLDVKWGSSDFMGDANISCYYQIIKSFTSQITQLCWKFPSPIYLWTVKSLLYIFSKDN